MTMLIILAGVARTAVQQERLEAFNDDRSALLDDAERSQDHNRIGGDGDTLSHRPGEHLGREQFAPSFLHISPNNRIPAIVDHAPEDGGGPLSIFESGAILEYLADKTAKLLSGARWERFEALQWLYWQMAGLGPMAGQNHHFAHYARNASPTQWNVTSMRPTASMVSSTVG